MTDINTLAKECVEIDRLKGFSLGYDIVDIEKHKWFLVAGIAGIHSEVSEMYEALRENDSTQMIKEGIDIIIRTLNFLSCLKDVDIDKELRKKMEINKERSYMHGDKIL